MGSRLNIHNYEPHIFAGNPIDRCDALRRSESDLRKITRSENCRVFVMRNFDPLISQNQDGEDAIAWLSLNDAAKIAGAASRIETFLGIDNEGAPLVAWNLHEDDSSKGSDRAIDISLLQDQRMIRFEDARQAAMSISDQETGILAQAKSNLDWHHRHRFCARCGGATEMRRGGLMRSCNRCNAEHFPRTDPVIITVVTNGEHCLLGQSAGRLRSMRMYSALAGFMDHGESIEEAVRREVKEEAGIDVGLVQYHSSQPWPFPSSLMIGSHAQALSQEIDKDDFEMTDVRWFPREDILLALAQKHPSLNVPGPIAIAHHLIKAWATGQAGDFRSER